MTTPVSNANSERKAKFTPNMDNFKVSLSYEGLSLKKSSEGKSIGDLKRKYAR
jgi:hypothetical protein